MSPYAARLTGCTYAIIFERATSMQYLRNDGGPCDHISRLGFRINGVEVLHDMGTESAGGSAQVTEEGRFDSRNKLLQDILPCGDMSRSWVVVHPK